MSFRAPSPPFRQSHRRATLDFSSIISPHSDAKNCPICLTTITKTRLAILSPCFHAYCFSCIRKWSHVKRTCPLCNSIFDSWLHRLDFRTRTFARFKPPPLRTKSESAVSGFRRSVSGRGGGGRVEESLLRSEYSRSRPLPRRRSFRPSTLEEAGQAAERVLQWRASIYRERLRAVPLDSSRSCHPQSGSGGSGGIEERIRRVSPWIRRELQAVLGDPDPTIIVHVVTSLYASSLQASNCVDSDFLAPLRPFLHDWTDVFWHELRCFAVSSLTMETYDTVVSYEKIGR